MHLEEYFVLFFTTLILLVFVRFEIQDPCELIAIEVQNCTGAKIFAKALYPEGFREIKPTAVRGETLYFDLSGLRKAWDANIKKHGYGAEPFIVLTVVKDGKVAVQGISLKGYDHYRKVTVLPEYKPLKTTKEVSLETISDGNIQPMDNYWQILEEYHEETIPVVVAEVINADYSWGHITYSYMANAHVGFGVYAFLTREWSRIGTHYTYEVNGGDVSYVEFRSGEDVYIWMDFTYRYERWKIHIDGQDFYEEYVFVKRFDPSSLSWAYYRPSNVRPAPINSWVFEGRKLSETQESSYYSFVLGDFDTNAFSIDVLGFISILSSAGMISPTAATAANGANLFIDVNYEYSSTQAFTCTLGFYGQPSTYHRVWRGESKTTVNNINTVPVVGFYISQG